MKKILLLLSLSLALFADNVKWTSYEKAIQTSKKPLFVFYSSENCGYCKKALTEMNSNKNFYSYVNTNFTSVYLDSETSTRLHAPVTPTFFVLTNNGDRVVNRLIGYQPSSELIRFLNKELYLLGN